MDEKGKGKERWSAAIANLTEMSGNLESLQKLLLKKAVFVDEVTYSKASLISDQARTIKVLDQRVETLERELDAAITSAAHARSEKRLAESAQKAAEIRTQETTKELENTSRVFELHMQELRAKQEEINKRDEDIKLLEAIIQTLGGKSPIPRANRSRTAGQLTVSAIEGASSSRKRPSFDDEDDPNNRKQKRVRFPKKKKEIEPALVKEEDGEETAPQDLSNPRLAAKERARHRSQMTTELFAEENDVDLTNIASAEVGYQEDGTFVDDGIQLEPFNLEREREEGFFDQAGNYVEYVLEKEEKDAWLDNLEVDPMLAERFSGLAKIVDEEEEEEQDLSSDEIAKIKRRIANVLEAGETVLQALKRLKGNSDKKAKMSAETKIVFDQLTEDAMKLMDNGDYNVYHEAREVFVREAEGYEALARARNNDLSGNGGDEFDMFADQDEDASNQEQNNQVIISSEGLGSQLSHEPEDGDSGYWTGQNDYVYDDATSYYYSSSLGYYFDPATGLFCSAASGQWYRYNEDSGIYDEVQPETE